MNVCAILVIGLFAILLLAVLICAHEARQEALKERDQ